MNATQVRREAKRRLDALSDQRLPTANDFLAYLEERDSNEATEELLRIPGILERLEEAEKQIAAGRTVPASKPGGSATLTTRRGSASLGVWAPRG